MKFPRKALARRASANMWWIIVGAVVALIVMIVLLVMFTSYGRDITTELSSCESKGGDCVSKCSGSVSKIFKCEGNLVCCFTEGGR